MTSSLGSGRRPDRLAVPQSAGNRTGQRGAKTEHYMDWIRSTLVFGVGLGGFCPVKASTPVDPDLDRIQTKTETAGLDLRSRGRRVVGRHPPFIEGSSPRSSASAPTADFAP